jgi:hypothetical protein
MAARGALPAMRPAVGYRPLLADFGFNASNSLLCAMNLPSELSQHHEEVFVPRWVQIPVGIALGGIVLLCLAGSLMMVFLPNEKAPVLAPAFGVFMSLVSLWALAKCVRLLSGKKVQGGGLLGPRALRALAWLFLLLPVGGLFSGYFVTHTAQAVLQTCAYVSIFFGLRSLAARRERIVR